MVFDPPGPTSLLNRPHSVARRVAKWQHTPLGCCQLPSQRPGSDFRVEAGSSQWHHQWTARGAAQKVSAGGYERCRSLELETLELIMFVPISGKHNSTRPAIADGFPQHNLHGSNWLKVL